jgi:hypothetical protein
MLASVCDRLRASEGEDAGIPTTAVDQVLDARQSGAITVGSDMIPPVQRPRSWP